MRKRKESGRGRGKGKGKGYWIMLPFCVTVTDTYADTNTDTPTFMITLPSCIMNPYLHAAQWPSTYTTYLYVPCTKQNDLKQSEVKWRIYARVRHPYCENWGKKGENNSKIKTIKRHITSYHMASYHMASRHMKGHQITLTWHKLSWLK